MILTNRYPILLSKRKKRYCHSESAQPNLVSVSLPKPSSNFKLAPFLFYSHSNLLVLSIAYRKYVVNE